MYLGVEVVNLVITGYFYIFVFIINNVNILNNNKWEILQKKKCESVFGTQ